MALLRIGTTVFDVASRKVVGMWTHGAWYEPHGDGEYDVCAPERAAQFSKLPGHDVPHPVDLVLAQQRGKR